MFLLTTMEMKETKLDYLRVGGWLTFYKVNNPRRTILGPRALIGIFVGFTEKS